MESNEIINSLKQIVQPYVQNQSAFHDFHTGTDFIRDLGINSAHLVDIVLDVEDEFNIAIDNEAMERMLTVEDVIVIIRSKTTDGGRE